MITTFTAKVKEDAGMLVFNLHMFMEEVRKYNISMPLSVYDKLETVKHSSYRLQVICVQDGDEQHSHRAMYRKLIAEGRCP